MVKTPIAQSALVPGTRERMPMRRQSTVHASMPQTKMGRRPSRFVNAIPSRLPTSCARRQPAGRGKRDEREELKGTHGNAERAHAEGERVARVEAGELEEVGAVAEDELDADHLLAHKHHRRDPRATEIGACGPGQKLVSPELRSHVPDDPPRKRSNQVAWPASRSSSSMVSLICARWRSRSVPELPMRRLRERLASSRRPLRTKYQGDSGTKGRPRRMSTGKTHWIASGILYAQLEVIWPVPLMTQEEMLWTAGGA